MVWIWIGVGFVVGMVFAIVCGWMRSSRGEMEITFNSVQMDRSIIEAERMVQRFERNRLEAENIRLRAMIKKTNRTSEK